MKEKSFPRAMTRRRLLLGAAVAFALRPCGAAAEPLIFGSLYKSFGVSGYEFADRVVAPLPYRTPVAEALRN